MEVIGIKERAFLKLLIFLFQHFRPIAMGILRRFLKKDQIPGAVKELEAAIQRTKENKELTDAEKNELLIHAARGLIGGVRLPSGVDQAESK